MEPINLLILGDYIVFFAPIFMLFFGVPASILFTKFFLNKYFNDDVEIE